MIKMPHPDWSKWELQVAEDVGGRVQPGSGNKWFAKGEVRTKERVISCKQTANSSFQITEMDLKEIEKIANQDLKYWALAVNLNGKPIIIIDYRDFLDLIK